MKLLSENAALRELLKLKETFRERIADDYEHKAKSCLTCETKGVCCTDAHFVNVHITRLEAVAMRQTLAKLNTEMQQKVYQRAAEVIEKYDLRGDGDTLAKTYSCPLFEKTVGCLVHRKAKPAPCIAHACYLNQEDLPPDKLQTAIEDKIERLNQRTYGKKFSWLAIPVWLDYMKTQLIEMDGINSDD